MLSSSTWSSKQQQHRRQQGSTGSTAAVTSSSLASNQQQPLPKLPGPKTTGYLQHHYQERQQQFQNLQQQQQQLPEEISINQTQNNNMNTTYQNGNNNNNNNNYTTSSSMDVPLLSDLLKVVGGESPTVDKHLYTLLSGIVAAVEVTNERVVELSEQYQELSLEVATVSRVIHSNQLAASSTSLFSSHLDQDHHHQQKQQKQQKMNNNTTTTTPKRIGAVQSQRPTTPVTMTAAAGGGSTQNHHQHQQHLATESVTALHTHAVADLENKIDNLAIRISKLQEEAGVRSKEAIEETYSEVLGLCEEERKKTNDQLQQMSRTIEGQMTVRLGELFSQGEMQLNEMVQDSFEKLKVCSEELTTSFSQTSKAFIENTSQSVSNCIKQATAACFEMISETRESALFASHQSALASYETESKMLHLYKSFEQLVTSSSSSSISAPVYHQHQQQPPLPFRCCSAIEEVRALYNLFQIDATEALRIFKNCQNWFTSNNNDSNNKNKNNTIQGGFNSNTADALSLCLRTPMLRCLEPLPSLGLQVIDSPKPTEGAEIVFIKEGGRAHLCGLRVGDIILRVDGRELGCHAASRGGLHLALMTAPNRPMPNGIKHVLASLTTTTTATENDEDFRSNTNNSNNTNRWMPMLPKQDEKALVLHHSSSSSSRISNKNSGGVKLTVYRFKDALTFTCTINLDP